MSLKINVPDLFPVALGWKVVEAVQLAPAASVLGLIGQVKLRGKSLGLAVMLVIVRVVDWLFVRVTVCGALVVPKA